LTIHKSIRGHRALLFKLASVLVLEWIFFGNEGVIADNDPDEQEKAIKFNDLVANLVILSTTLDISAAVNRLLAQGFPVHAEDLATISPYQKDNVKRFGEYILDMSAAAGELDGRLEFPADLVQPGSVIAGNGSSPEGTTSEKHYSRK
jgi:hypothetical protein